MIIVSFPNLKEIMRLGCVLLVKFCLKSDKITVIGLAVMVSESVLELLRRRLIITSKISIRAWGGLSSHCHLFLMWL